MRCVNRIATFIQTRVFIYKVLVLLADIA